jgi:membrane protein DedA with SNARE-associated domain
MTISDLVQQYGYYAVFIGTFLEGETVLLFSGFAAHRGLLQLQYVILLAFLASTLGDQLFFILGRVYGKRLLSRYPSLEKQLPRIELLLAKYHSPLILGIRFMYGLRIAGPVIMGTLKVSPLRFAALNLIGAAVWASLIAWLGYQFGNLLELLLQDLKKVEEAILIATLCASLGWAIFRHYSKKGKTS